MLGLNGLGTSFYFKKKFHVLQADLKLDKSPRLVLELLTLLSSLLGTAPCF